MKEKKVKTATLIDNALEGFTGEAKLWKLSEKLEGNTFVVTSATYVLGSGPETYIFGANAKGEVSSFLELYGSFRGAIDHKKAIEDAGYVILKSDV